jgi:hypothetical protein
MTGIKRITDQMICFQTEWRVRQTVGMHRSAITVDPPTTTEVTVSMLYFLALVGSAVQFLNVFYRE